MNPAPISANRPLRIIRAACYFGLAEIIALFIFLALHPLNTKPMEIRQASLGFAILAFPYACLFTCTIFVREFRLMSWLLLVPTALVLLVMSWGCFVCAVVADSFMRDEAAGRRSMNCAGFPWMFEVPLSYLISIGAFAVCAASFGVNRRLVRSPLPASPKETS